MSSYLEIPHYGNLAYNYIGYTSNGVIIAILSPLYAYNNNSCVFAINSLGTIYDYHYIVPINHGVYLIFTQITKFMELF